MAIREVDPREVAGWLASGEAVLVDVREADEFRREHIEGAGSRPLASVDMPGLLEQAGREPNRKLVLLCASGARSRAAADRVPDQAGVEVCVLKGGVEAWKRAGLAVVRDAKAPLPLMRQVQITAGGMVLLGFVLGVLVSPWWHVLSGLVGAGLMMAGITGFCGMANLLRVMPWNRSSAPA